MVKIMLIILMSLVSFIGLAQNQNSQDEFFKVTIEINNITSDKGTVYYSIYDSEENFENRIPLISQRAIIKEGKSTISFDELKEGTYAILCYHDKNDNKKMDFSLNGMPLEDYGMTNNVMFFGPPIFSDAKFEVSDTNLIFEIKF